MFHSQGGETTQKYNIDIQGFLKWIKASIINSSHNMTLILSFKGCFKEGIYENINAEAYGFKNAIQVEEILDI